MIFGTFCLLSLLAASKGKFIDTKHMSGGVFSWPHALVAQRNLWASAKFFPIKFYKGDINIPKLVDIIYDKLDLNFSINEMIQDAFDSINGVESDDDTYMLRSLKQNVLAKFNRKAPKEDYDGGSDETWEECPKDDYPNANLLGSYLKDYMDLNLNEYLDCATQDELLGQIFSFAFIIVPIIVMFVLFSLFYIFYCCGCCCCCRAKDRYGPGIVSIVFFAIIIALMVISIIFSLMAAAYMAKIVSYGLSGDAVRDIDYSLGYIKPTVDDVVSSFTNDISGTIKSATSNITSTVSNLLDDVVNYINGKVSNFSSLNDLFDHVSDINSTNINQLEKENNTFSDCINNQPLNTDNCKQMHDDFTNPFGYFPLDSIRSMVDTVDPFKKQIEEFNTTLSKSEAIDDIKNKFNDIFDNITDSLDDIDIINDLDVDDTTLQKYEKNVIEPKYQTILKAFFFIVPFIMILMTALEAMAFWTKTCCSRCVVCCCCSRFICNCCLFFLGMMCTFVAFATIFIDLLYDQGDDSFDAVLKKMLNENRTIVLGSIDLHKYSQDMISSIQLEEIKINKPRFIKNFVDAKLETKFTDFISITEIIPIENVGESIGRSISGIKANTSIITNIATDTIDEITKELKDVKVELPVGEIEEIIKDVVNQSNALIKSYLDPCTTCTDKFNNTLDQFQFLFNNISGLDKEIPQAFDQVYNNLNSIPDELDLKVNNMFTNVLGTVGEQIPKITSSITPAINKFDSKWIISIFNIARVQVCYYLIGSALAFSISAHLFMVSMVAMTILLCVRRKGMGKIARDKSVSISYSYSYSEYSSEKKDKKKKKKKKGGDSDEENTSDGNNKQPLGLLDIDERGVNNNEDKDSDDESNLSNPYKRDSSTNNNNDENSNSDTEQNNDTESQAKISENDDESTTHNNNQNNVINFSDDTPSDDKSSFDDGDQQTFVF